MQLNRTVSILKDFTDKWGGQTHRWSQYNVMDGIGTYRNREAQSPG